jgi:large subunit ribosomal protein L25
MAQTYELVATVRDRVGKGAARALRREHKIPAVIYGEGKPAMPIALPHKDVSLKLLGGGFLTTLVTIDVGGEKVLVLPRDYQVDPVRDTLTHVDFFRIGRGTRITVEIPVQFINETASPGLKRGGVLNIVRHEVEVECPADSIPEHIVCDLTGLDIGDSLHISAVKLAEGVSPTIQERDFTIATIAAPAGLKEEDETAAAAEGTAAPTA